MHRPSKALHHSHQDPSIHQHTTMDFDPDPIETEPTNAFNSTDTHENPRTMNKTINNRNKSNHASSVQLISASKSNDSVSNGTHRNENAMDAADKRGRNEEVNMKHGESGSGDSVSPVIPIQPSKPVCFRSTYMYNHKLMCI